MEIYSGEGKYFTVVDNGEIIIYRYGSEWRNETGDGYILSLLSLINDLTEELEETKRSYDDQVDSLENIISDLNEEVCYLSGQVSELTLECEDLGDVIADLNERLKD
ncbi:hypothetical protein vecB_090 [Escherichia phage VEcB]|uniref:Uncharacterized protein n=1 Tax=Escherichia phage VEcB TaxID=2776821 RepID=A0A7L8ZG59_9CAUD|nr:hol-like chemotaxis [Escherichia phage VEcB]AMM43430.1 hypothetical protein ECGD1_104 [Enterobacteria phage ECGD1]QOI68028.1 hypothetical protein vecB_090 [Escherichia phage VEcB]WBF54106.1 hypothetical protein [Escherichia phage EC_OE_11]